MSADRPGFRLTLVPTGPGPPAELRLRAALLGLLRRHGLRCVLVEPVEGPPATPAGTAATAPADGGAGVGDR